MYQIVSCGEVIALCDQPRYITVNPATGVYVETDKEHAIGIAVGGKSYNLPDGTAIPDAPEALARVIDEGEYIFGQDQKIAAQATAGSIMFVTLAESGDIDATTAAEHADLFAPWAYPIAYKTGNIRRYNEVLYRCVQDHTSQADWTPDTASSLWKLTADPAEEWPDWSQPVGAHDAYSLGDKVSHNEKHWISTVENNVWEPGIYGWENQEENQ